MSEERRVDAGLHGVDGSGRPPGDGARRALAVPVWELPLAAMRACDHTDQDPQAVLRAMRALPVRVRDLDGARTYDLAAIASASGCRVESLHESLIGLHAERLLDWDEDRAEHVVTDPTTPLRELAPRLFA